MELEAVETVWSERYKDLCEFLPHPPRVRLTGDESGILAWVEDDNLIRWRDTSKKEHVFERRGVLMDDLWMAAEMALYEGAWLYALHVDTKLLPRDCTWLKNQRRRERVRRTPEVIPIGAGTSLLSMEALASVFYCHTDTLRNWLRETSIPILRLPGGQSYTSLWAIELGIVKSLYPELSWPECAELMKSAQSVYQAANRNEAIQRLHKIGQSLKPNSNMLRRRKPQPLQKSRRPGRHQQQ